MEICPLCKGVGSVELTGVHKKRQDKAKQIRALINAGKSYRDIIKLMGYKSTSIITHYLKKK